MINHGRGLRRDAHFGVAASISGKCQEHQVGEPQFPGSPNQPLRLREVDFQFEEHKLRGLEQNPETRSRWAQLARQGKKVMQFVEQRPYIAVVVDGKV